MKLTNKHGLPDALVRAVKNDDYSHTGEISLTTMIGPARIRQLTLRHWDSLEEDVESRIYSLLGQSIHLILERAEEEGSGDIHELRLEHETNGVVWSGMADLYKQKEKEVDDYKVTSTFSYTMGVKDEWLWQLNLLGFLFRQAGHPVESLAIVAIFRDWSKYKMMQNKDYPKRQVMRIPIPLWSDAKCEEYAFKRIVHHKNAENLSDKELPYCTDKEMWARPTKYAIKKNKNKRATKLCDSMEEAENYKREYEIANPKNKYKIEVRKGERIRCQNYCPVSYYCNQYQEYLGPQKLQELSEYEQAFQED